MARTCIFVGEGAVLLGCLRHAFDSPLTVSLVITRDEEAQHMASEAGIRWTLPCKNMATLLPSSVDYLFSVVNDAVLSDDFLGRIEQAAINYHDAPLPRHAGSHATSWALMQQDRSHAITWHMMTSLVDGGDILVQRPVPIEAGDTAFSLNLRCMRTAIEGFARLLDDILNDRLQRRSQDLEKRTYHRRRDRPPVACILNLRQSAADIVATVRGLSFGKGYDNPLGSAKIYLENDVFAVVGSASIGDATTQPAGTVVAVKGGRIDVAAQDRVVSFGDLATVEGEPIPIDKLRLRHRIEPGVLLPTIEASTREEITHLATRLAASERFWRARLASLRPANIGRTPAPPLGLRRAKQPSSTLACLDALASCIPDGEGSHVALHAPLRNHNALDALLRDGLFSADVPLALKRDPDEQRAELDTVLRKGSFLRDLVVRSPDLAPNWRDQLRVAFEWATATPLDAPQARADVVLRIDREGFWALVPRFDAPVPASWFEALGNALDRASSPRGGDASEAWFETVFDHATPEANTAKKTRAARTPKSAFEEQVMAACHRVGLANVGRNDDLLSRGASAPVMAQLQNELESRFAVRLPRRALFAATTVVDLSRLIANARLESRGLRTRSQLVRDATQRAPRYETPLQRELSEQCSGVLDLEAIDPRQDLFDLGATTLELMQVRQWASDRHGIDIPLRQWLSAATVVELERLVVRAKRGNRSVDNNER